MSEQNTIQALLPRFEVAPSVIPLYNANFSVKANIGGSLSTLAPCKIKQLFTIPTSPASPVPIGYVGVSLYDAGVIDTLDSHYMNEGDYFVSDTGVTTKVLSVTAAGQFIADTSILSNNEISDLAALVSLVRIIEFRKAVFFGKKSNRTSNASEIYIGPSNPALTNDLASMKIPPWSSAGDEFVIEAAPGCKLSLHDLYIDVVTSGDGVLVVLH